jgi:hypothetical protein
MFENEADTTRIQVAGSHPASQRHFIIQWLSCKMIGLYCVLSGEHVP